PHARRGHALHDGSQFCAEYTLGPLVVSLSTRDARLAVSRFDTDAEIGGRVQPRVEQMARRDVGERLQHRLLDAGMLALELGEEPLGALPLQAEVAARRAATADNRQLA